MKETVCVCIFIYTFCSSLFSTAECSILKQSTHAAEMYEKELKKSGYILKLKYKPTNQNSNNKIIAK